MKLTGQKFKFMKMEVQIWLEDIKINNARKIVDTRNRIIHGYDLVSEDIIWAIVSTDLKKLQEEINQLLEE